MQCKTAYRASGALNACGRQKKPKSTQVAFFQGKRNTTENHLDLMKAKIDSDKGRKMITRRFATVEPVFGNLRGNKRLHRFTLPGWYGCNWDAFWDAIRLFRMLSVKIGQRSFNV